MIQLAKKEKKECFYVFVTALAYIYIIYIDPVGLTSDVHLCNEHQKTEKKKINKGK